LHAGNAKLHPVFGELPKNVNLSGWEIKGESYKTIKK